MNKVFGQIQNAIFQVFQTSDADIDAPKLNDLVTTVTDDQELWQEYCAAAKKNKIVTNLGCKEYLFIFIQENRECIEEQYYVLKSNDKKNSKAPSMNYSDTPNYFGNIKRRLSNSNKTPNNLCKTIMQSLSDETLCSKEHGKDYKVKNSSLKNSLNHLRRYSELSKRSSSEEDLLESVPTSNLSLCELDKCRRTKRLSRRSSRLLQ